MGFIKMFITVNKRAPWAAAHLPLDVFFAEKLKSGKKEPLISTVKQSTNPSIVIAFTKISMLEIERFINMLGLRNINYRVYNKYCVAN